MLITLTKAARLQENLRRKLATLRLSPETTLPIFIADPAGETGRRAGALTADIDRGDRLLAALAEIRAPVAADSAAGRRGMQVFWADRGNGRAWRWVTTPS